MHTPNQLATIYYYVNYLLTYKYNYKLQINLFNGCLTQKVTGYVFWEGVLLIDGSWKEQVVVKNEQSLYVVCVCNKIV